MLGTFPEVFSQPANSQGYFPSVNFLKEQFPKRLLPKSVIAAALNPPFAVCCASEGLTNLREVAAWKIVI